MPGTLVADLVGVQAVRVPVPVRRDPLPVHLLGLAAGPRADGVTGNTGILWLGGAAVAVGSGFPLLPGAVILLGPQIRLDLSSLWLAADVDAADVLRLFYYLP